MQRTGQRWLRIIARHPKGWGSAAILLFIAAAGLVAPWVAPHDPETQRLQDALQPPVFANGSWSHPLGTDYHGRDILSRILYGSRVSLGVGLLSVVLSMSAGTTIGLVAGYFGGWVDEVLMRLADVALAFPPIILAIAILALFPPNPLVVSIVVASTTWVWFARTVRSVVLRLRELEFVTSAQAAGASHGYILLRHILPNTFPSIAVTATSMLGFAVLLEAALSFFGLSGTTLSWGWDIAQARDFVTVAWWMVTMPGLALFITVMAINLLGDYLRDELDPRLRGIG